MLEVALRSKPNGPLARSWAGACFLHSKATMATSRCVLLLLATLVLSPSLPAAQQKPPRPAKPAVPAAAAPAPKRAVASPRDPFLGVWKLSAEKSKYESGGAPRGFTRTYEARGGGTIFMTTDVTVPEGNTRAYIVYRRDGQPYPEAAVGAQSIRMVAVKAIDSRTEDVYFILDGKMSERPSTITISGDGQTMTQVVSGTNAKGQPFTNTVVYDRQP
jgi:hypothetical protein